MARTKKTPETATPVPPVPGPISPSNPNGNPFGGGPPTSAQLTGTSPPFIGSPPIRLESTYAAIWNAVSKSYRSYDDEAKKNSYQNALAMRRDAFLLEQIRARQYPTAQLEFELECDDPEDARQQDITDQLTKIVNRIPRFNNLKMSLLEAIWYGKFAVQIIWGWVNIGGVQRLIPVKNYPVNGDKLIYKYNELRVVDGSKISEGTPGVLIYPPYHPDGAPVTLTDRGPALFLETPFWRDRFIIHNHEPDDLDYLFESDLAGGIHGIGVRGRIYWLYQVRLELLSWTVDALQRLGTGGMLVGKYPSGNAAAQAAMADALKNLCRDNVVTMPVDPEMEAANVIEHIDPSPVGYEVLFKFIKDYFDPIIRRFILGQSMSAEAHSTGLNSHSSDNHMVTLDRILSHDAINLSETLTEDLIKPIIKYNFGELDFGVRLKLQSEKTNIKEQMEAATMLYQMGVALDATSLRDMAGFVAPSDEAETIQLKQEEPGDGDGDGDFAEGGEE